MGAEGSAAWVRTDSRLFRDTPGLVVDRVVAGEPIGFEDACCIIDADDSALAEVMAVARRLRVRHKGTTVTYSPKVFLPITNLCRNLCSYCVFRKHPGDPAAWTMLPEEVQSWCREGRNRGAIEALMCLGDKPELAFASHRQTLRRLGHPTTVAYVRQACEIALREGLLPHVNAGLMSRAEMEDLKPVNVSMGLMLETISPRLAARGGPHHHAPDKDPVLRLRMIHEAGELKIPFTTGILVGIGETRHERIASLLAIRDAHERYGHIQEVIIQNFRRKPMITMATRTEPSALEMARTIAVCRLLMPAMNIQAPPNLSPDDHALLLNAGVNDWGGISSLTPDYVNPEAPWPHVTSLAETCRREGSILKTRLPIYAEYLGRPGFLDKALLPRVREVAAARGVSVC